MQPAHCVEALTANRLRLGHRFARLGLAWLWPVFFTPLGLAQNAASVQPEAASGWTDKPGWAFQQRGVAAAHPLASEAGYRILQAGGSAVDAAIAVQMVLTLVEPQSSGIGGGAFLLHHDGRQLQVFDGRETAPVLAPPDLFMLHGKPLPFNQVVAGGRAVGVPGLLRMLAIAHQQHGRLPWASLFQPAIELADKGFAISPRLHALLKAEPSLLKDPQAVAYFFNPDGTPLPVGHVLTNPGLAKALRMVAKQGADAFYTGPLAQRIVDKVQLHANNPGLLTMGDMQKYRPQVRDAMCFSHTATTPSQAVNICGVGPPSSGLITMGQMFGMLAARPSADPEMDSVEWRHQYNEAARLAFADRAMYIADPLFVQAPGSGWGSLLNKSYLQERATLIGAQRLPKAEAGSPEAFKSSYAPMPAQTELGTSQSLWAMLHHGKDAQQAVNAPHSGVSSPNGPLLLEKNRFNAVSIDGLRARGHEVLSIDMPSGLQALQRKAQVWSGAADPRREGWVSGD